MRNGYVAVLLGLWVFCAALPAAADVEIDDGGWDMIEILDPAGKPVSFDKVRKPVTFMVFWSTWCKPCLHELPDVQALAKRMAKDKQVRILVVNVDKPDASAAHMKKLLKKTAPGLALYRDTKHQLIGQVLERDGLSFALPLTAVLNKQGQLSTLVGAADCDRKKLLKDWMDWIDEAKRGELSDKGPMPGSAPVFNPPPPASEEGEILNMDYPKDMPAAELDKEMQQVRLAWKKRYPHLTEAQVEELIHQIKTQVRKDGWVEVKIPGPRETPED